MDLLKGCYTSGDDMSDDARNKMMGSEASGNVPETEFFFPSDGDLPAIAIRARTYARAVEKRNALFNLRPEP